MFCVSELRGLGAFQLKLELVCDKRDELRICGFSLGIGHGIAKEPLQSIQIAPVPGYFDGVADGTFDARRRGAECLGNLGVQYLRNGVGVLTARLGALPDALFETYK